MLNGAGFPSVNQYLSGLFLLFLRFTLCKKHHFSFDHFYVFDLQYVSEGGKSYGEY
ncbi:hypothetical protein D2M30_2652 [Bacillus amyloliquefaciens]|nr:hypothetical protein D2M30_2652 [Bacillus amyloliquefaciens]